MLRVASFERGLDFAGRSFVIMIHLRFMKWYYLNGQQQVGPVSEEDLRGLLNNNTLKGSDLVWKDGMQDWVTAETVYGAAQSPQASQAMNSGQPGELAQQVSTYINQPSGGSNNIYAAPQSNLIDGGAVEELVQGVTIKRANFPLLLITSIVGFILFFTGYMILIFGAEPEFGLQGLLPLGGLLLVVGLSAFIFAIVLSCKYLYRSWYIINVATNGNTITTPGKAVGFMFIPFFSLYWMYQALWGWSKEYNRVFQNRQVRPTDGVFLTYCICSMPIINYLGGMVNMVLGPMMMYQMEDQFLT